MLGLGCGVGPTTLLTSLPQLRLVVVERDAAVIALALECFPRLAAFVRAGRLAIVHADAAAALTGHGPEVSTAFDFVLVDVYDGTPRPPAFLRDRAVVAALALRAPILLIDAIFAVGDPSHRAWLDAFDGRHPIVAMIPTATPRRWALHPHNWILSTVPLADPIDPACLGPADELVAQTRRSDLAWMQRHQLAPDGRPPPEFPHDGHGGTYVRIRPADGEPA